MNTLRHIAGKYARRLMDDIVQNSLPMTNDSWEDLYDVLTVLHTDGEKSTKDVKAEVNRTDDVKAEEKRPAPQEQEKLREDTYGALCAADAKGIQLTALAEALGISRTFLYEARRKRARITPEFYEKLKAAVLNGVGGQVKKDCL